MSAEVEPLYYGKKIFDTVEDRMRVVIDEARGTGLTYVEIIGLLEGLKHELLDEWKHDS